jgi:hypothetical protein
VGKNLKFIDLKIDKKSKLQKTKEKTMISGWKKRENCWMNIVSPDIVPEQIYKGYLETREPGLLGLKEPGKRQNAGYAEQYTKVIMTRKSEGYGTYPAELPGFIWKQSLGE